MSYGHITSVNLDRATNQLLAYWTNRNMKSFWLTEVIKEIQELGITESDIEASFKRGLKQERFQDREGDHTLKRREKLTT